MNEYHAKDIRKAPITLNGAAQVVLGQPVQKGDGQYVAILLDGEPVGKLGFLCRDGELADFVNSEIDERYRGSGIWQLAVQQLANMFPQGLRAPKYQASMMAHKAFRKLPTVHETDGAYLVSPVEA